MRMAEIGALIVEDDGSWQQILTEILGDAGLSVEVVASLAEALVAIRAQAHRVAVVDLSLGGSDHHNQDGLKVLQALRLQDPGCTAILLTGFATVELAVSALTEYGVFTCLRKEAFRRTQFRELIQQVMASAPPVVSQARSPEIPGSALESQASPADETLTEDISTGRKPALQVLVVEDDAGWRGILHEILADAGLQVRLCCSYGEALGRLRRDRFDLAVIDLSLSDPLPVASDWNGISGTSLDGYRLLASTRAGSLPTVVVSGVASPVDIERAYAEHGIFAYLQKQVFDRQVFLQTVQEALASARDNRERAGLTEREQEVLEMLARGLTNKEIAEAMVISTNTVKRHLKAIFDKLETHTRSGAVAKAVGIGAIRERDDPD